jgi:tetratricopeptide (TPR) repeat protein
MTTPPPNLDDTQPVRRVTAEPQHAALAPTITPPETEEDSEGGRGIGCGMFTLVSVVLALFGLAIVALSAGAGWTNGQRAARATAAATVQSGNQAQADAVANDIAQGNYSLADTRIRYLATNAPAIPQLPALLQTGTAVYLILQPTVTPTPTPTHPPNQTPDAPAATATPQATATLADPYNLSERLNRAQSAVSLGQWREAINELDIILAIDPAYEVVTVRSLMSRSLNELALFSYRTGSLAEAIYLTDRAEEFGPLRDGLNYERYIATLYLSARSKVGTSDYTGALNALREIYNQSPNYNNGEISQMLFRTYVAYADALTLSSPCFAVEQYNAALRLFNDASVSGKRLTAETYCANGTPTPEGFVPTPADGFDPFAPTPQP